MKIIKISLQDKERLSKTGAPPNNIYGFSYDPRYDDIIKVDGFNVAIPLMTGHRIQVKITDKKYETGKLEKGSPDKDESTERKPKLRIPPPDDKS